MASLFFNIYLYLRLRNYFYHNGVYYIHHMPERGNLGDYLCSPRHYFDLKKKSGSKLVVLGGGVFSEYGRRKLRKLKLPSSSVVLWGVGESTKDIRPSAVLDLPYMAWGIRDADFSDEHFLPCVSCMHSMLDMPVPKEESILCFANADSKVTSKGSLDEFRKFSERVKGDFLLNNCSENHFIEALQKATHIVTNSYHGAYWGLLSGRKVTLMGYSSKFYNLFKVMGLRKERVIGIGRGDDSSLIKALDGLDLSRDFVLLEKSSEMREKFRMINIGFAESLAHMGAVDSFSYNLRSYKVCKD